MILNCLAVGFGGFLGAVCRYLSGLVPLKNETVFPVKTFMVNIVGCFVIGIVAALALKNFKDNPRLVLFLKAGICGGFTTFSSFALETGDLLKSGHTAVAFTYVILSVVIGTLMVFLSQLLIKN